MVKKVTAILVMVVLHLATACAPAAPTPMPTPEPRATPVEVRATKPEHLEGIWLKEGFDPTLMGSSVGPYYRWDVDGTLWTARDAQMTTNLRSAKFWFEDGLYHEDENPQCVNTLVYEIYLRIEGGRAVGLRMEYIDQFGPSATRCGDMTTATGSKLWHRVD